MIISIDPGLTGGIGVLSNHGGFVAAYPMPVKRGSATKTEVDAVALVELLLKHRGDAMELSTVIVEKQHAFPKIGSSANFSKGESAGVIRGVCAALSLPVERVTPQSWKKFYKLHSDKEQSRGLAIDIFPMAPLQRKKDEGVAEALLIGRWWALQ
jgi:crossover junction endodeoxyribonuclease RuvC